MGPGRTKVDHSSAGSAASQPPAKPTKAHPPCPPHCLALTLLSLPAFLTTVRSFIRLVQVCALVTACRPDGWLRGNRGGGMGSGPRPNLDPCPCTLPRSCAFPSPLPPSCALVLCPRTLATADSTFFFLLLRHLSVAARCSGAAHRERPADPLGLRHLTIHCCHRRQSGAARWHAARGV